MCIRDRVRTGNTGKVVMPHDHQHVLATYHKAGEKEVQMAIDAAMAAHKEWSELDWTVRATILLKIADLIAGKYRAVINASTTVSYTHLDVYKRQVNLHKIPFNGTYTGNRR